MADRTKNGRLEQRPAFQFYPLDFLASPKVRRMSPAARGAYITLLCDQWLEGPLSGDLAALADRCSMELAEFQREWSGPLGRCFDVLDDGRIVNARLERERGQADEFSNAQSLRGRYGLEKRYGKVPEGVSFEEWLSARAESSTASQALAPAIAKSSSHPTPPHPTPPQRENPPTPPGGGGEGPPDPPRDPGARRPKASTCSLEEQLAEFEFATIRSDVAEAARTWSEYRRTRKPRTAAWGPRQWRPALRGAITDPGGFVAAVEHSIAQGYQGLIPNKPPGAVNGSKHGGNRQTVEELFDAAREAARMLGEPFSREEARGA